MQRAGAAHPAAEQCHLTWPPLFCNPRCKNLAPSEFYLEIGGVGPENGPAGNDTANPT